MKRSIGVFLFVCFGYMLFAQDPSWYIKSGSADNGQVIDAGQVYEMEGIGAPSAPVEHDVLAVFKDGSYYYSDGAASFSYPFLFASQEQLSYLYFTHKYDTPPPPPNIVQDGSGGAVNVFSPATIGVPMAANNSAVPEKDLTLIVQLDTGEFKVTQRVVDANLNTVPAAYVQPSNVFDGDFTMPAGINFDPARGMTSGNLPSNGTAILNYAIPNTYVNLAVPANASSSYQLELILTYGGVDYPLYVPILTANDPNYLSLYDACLDEKTGLTTGYFRLSFLNDGTAPAQSIGVKMFLPQAPPGPLNLEELKISRITNGGRTIITDFQDVLDFVPRSASDLLHFDFQTDQQLGVGDRVTIEFDAILKMGEEKPDVTELLDDRAITGYSIFNRELADTITYVDSLSKIEDARNIKNCKSSISQVSLDCLADDCCNPNIKRSLLQRFRCFFRGRFNYLLAALLALGIGYWITKRKQDPS